MEVVNRIQTATAVTVRQMARLGAKSLPFMPAASVRPGMVMFAEDGSYELVESVERVELRCSVYDIDVEDTHNFIANGLLTHNSVYGFRGADIQNILGFERDFPDAKVVKLEQNYRSTQTILNASNGVIANNRQRKDKFLWSELGEGDPGACARARGRACRGALRRVRDRAARGAGRVARRDRRLLPHERPEPRARGHAGALRGRLPGDRRHALLRARRDQGCARVPDAACEPRGHGRVRPRRELAAARHRDHDAGAAGGLREHDR